MEKVRLIRDTARKLHGNYKEVFTCCVVLLYPNASGGELSALVDKYYHLWQDNASLPQSIEDTCIDILTCRVHVEIERPPLKATKKGGG